MLSFNNMPRHRIIIRQRIFMCTYTEYIHFCVVVICQCVCVCMCNLSEQCEPEKKKKEEKESERAVKRKENARLNAQT